MNPARILKLFTLPALALVLLVSARESFAATNEVRFSLADLNGNPIAFKQIRITPSALTFPSTEGASVIGLDWAFRATDANGVLTQRLVSGIFTIRFTNQFVSSTFTILTPSTNFNGVLEAADLITSSTNLGGNLVAYSMTASDNLFARRTNAIRILTNGVSAAIGYTNINLTNITAHLSGDTLNLSATASGGLTTNANQFGGSPLSIKSGAILTNLTQYIMGPTPGPIVFEQLPPLNNDPEAVLVTTNSFYWHGSGAGAAASMVFDPEGGSGFYVTDQGGSFQYSGGLFYFRGDEEHHGLVSFVSEAPNFISLTAGSVLGLDGDKQAISTAVTVAELEAYSTRISTATNRIETKQNGSIFLTNIVAAGNGTGMLTNNGIGTLGWMAIPSGGGGVETNLQWLPIQSYSVVNSNAPALTSAGQAWALMFPYTNAVGSNEPLSATWSFDLPSSYTTNSALLRGWTFINATNGPNASNVCWRVSALRLVTNSTDFAVGTYQPSLLVTSSIPADFAGTNKLQEFFLPLGTNIMMAGGESGVLKIERVGTNDTYRAGAALITRLRLEYTQ